VPALVKQGYAGAVYCSPATASLLRILWPDSGRIQEEDAAQANRHRSTIHDPAEPLYTEADALRALGHSYRAIEASGVMMPVVEAGIQYHQPARFDDVLTVRVETFAFKKNASFGVIFV
jgi:hypothetical protein